MGGQDGFARDPLSYDTDNDVVMAGIRLHPRESLDLGLSLTWTESEAAIAPFDLADDAADYVATHPTTVYDFSMSHTYSDLDVSRFDAEADATYHFSKSMQLSLRYRRAEYDDNAPYLYDTTGSFDLWTIALAWKL
jgi:hypothetical protein